MRKKAESSEFVYSGFISRYMEIMKPVLSHGAGIQSELRRSGSWKSIMEIVNDYVLFGKRDEFPKMLTCILEGKHEMNRDPEDTWGSMFFCKNCGYAENDD